MNNIIDLSDTSRSDQQIDDNKQAFFFKLEMPQAFCVDEWLHIVIDFIFIQGHGFCFQATMAIIFSDK